MADYTPLVHISEDGLRYHSLYDDLKGTAEKASEFAAAFDCAEWG